jgi:hypothetical protein
LKSGHGFILKITGDTGNTRDNHCKGLRYLGFSDTGDFGPVTAHISTGDTFALCFLFRSIIVPHSAFRDIVRCSGAARDVENGKAIQTRAHQAQGRLNHAPFEVGQVVLAHTDPESEFGAMWKPPVGPYQTSTVIKLNDMSREQASYFWKLTIVRTTRAMRSPRMLGLIRPERSSSASP